jgi:hypothetical protein
MARKLLFVVFRFDECAIMHAIWYAQELLAHGHTVRIILEGEATNFLGLERVAEQLARLPSGVVAGACKAASRAMGCCKDPAVKTAASDPAWQSPLHEAAHKHAIPLLDAMHGHASIAEYIDQGFEMITF